MLQVQSQIERRLSSELDDDSIWSFFPDDMENVLEREGFEIETIGCVVVGGHRLRIAVDHDGLKPFVLQSEGCVAAAAIEFNPLSYPVGTTTEDHDLLAIAGFGLILFLVRRVEVWRVRLEFCGAC